MLLSSLWTNVNKLVNSNIQNAPVVVDPLALKKESIVESFNLSEKYSIANGELNKGKESKLRFTLDALVSENLARKKKLDEFNLRLHYLQKDDISNLQLDENDVIEKYKEDFESENVDRLRMLINKKFDYKSTKDPKQLYEKFLFMMATYQIVENKLAKERDQSYILKAKIADLKFEKERTDKGIKKKDFLLSVMNKRFTDLEKTEFAAKNRLIRAQNRLLGMKSELDKIEQKKKIYFDHKKSVRDSSYVAAEEAKNLMADNLMLLDKLREEKKETDEKLNRILMEEKQILSKRKDSKLTLLYIDLLEKIEQKYLLGIQDSDDDLPLDESMSKRTKRSDSTRSPISRRTIKSMERQRSEIGSPTRSPSRFGKSPRRSTSVLFFKPTKSEFFETEEVMQKREIVLSRITEFFEGHPEGITKLGEDIRQKYKEMVLYHQSISNTYVDMNATKKAKEQELEQQNILLQKLKQQYNVLNTQEEAQEDETIMNSKKEIPDNLLVYTDKLLISYQNIVDLLFDLLQRTALKFCETSRTLNEKSKNGLPVAILKLLEETEEFLLQIGKGSQSKKGIISMSKLAKPPTIYDSIAKKLSLMTTAADTRSTKENEKRGNQGTAGNPLEIPKELDETEGSPSHMTYDANHEAISIELGLDVFSDLWFGDQKELVEKWKQGLMKVRRKESYIMKQEKVVLACLSKEDIKTMIKKYANNYPTPTEELVQQLVEELRDHARKIQQFRMVELVDSIGNFIKRYTEISIKKKEELKRKHGMQAEKEYENGIFDMYNITDYIKRTQQARVGYLETIAQEEDEEASKLHQEKTVLSIQKPEVEKVDDMKKITQQINTLADFYKAKSRNPSAELSKILKHKPSSGRSSSVGRSTHNTSLPNLSHDLSRRSKDMRLSDYIFEQQNRSARKKKYDDPEEDYLDEQRESIKEMSYIQQQKSFIEQKKAEKFVPNMMLRERFKPAWDGAFKKFKADKTILQKIGLLGQRHTEFDIKSKDTERMKNYVPDLKILQKLKVMTLASTQKPETERTKNLTLVNNIAEDWKKIVPRKDESLSISPPSKSRGRFSTIIPEKVEMGLNVSHNSSKSKIVLRKMNRSASVSARSFTTRIPLT